MADTTLVSPNPALSLSRIREQVNSLFDRLNLIQEQYALIRQLDQSILNSGSSAAEPFRILIGKGLRHTGASHGQIVSVKRNRLVVVACSDSRRIDTVLPLVGSLCGKAVRTGQSQHCSDLSQLDKDEFLRFHASTKSELVLLIRHEENSRILGLLSLEKDQAGGFDEASISFAELLAGQAALAFEQARRWQSVELLYHVSTDLLAGDLSPGQAYQKILDAVLETINFEHGQVLKLVGDELLIVASSRKNDLGLLLGPSSSICGRYLLKNKGREILTIPCVSESPYKRYYLPLLATTDQAPMRSEMIVPILEGDRLIGAINIESPQVDPFSEFDAKLLGVVRELMAQAFSATSLRNRLSSHHRTEAANLAMTQLGNVAQKFLHDFRAALGDARGRMIELQEHLRTCDLPSIRGGTVESFIAGIVGYLGSAGQALKHFMQRFNPDQPQFQVQQMNLEEVLETCLAEFRRRRSLHDIEIRFSSLLPSTEAPKRQIAARAICELTAQVGDVIDNLLNNAVDAIQERRQAQHDSAPIKGLVEILLDLPDPLSARIRIRDNGIGIPADCKDRIFTFGYSSKPRDGPQGGIGLWFCRLYVIQRGGSISVSSEPGQGTTFELIFPLVVS